MRHKTWHKIYNLHLFFLSKKENFSVWDFDIKGTLDAGCWKIYTLKLHQMRWHVRHSTHKFIFTHFSTGFSSQCLGIWKYTREKNLFLKIAFPQCWNFLPFFSYIGVLCFFYLWTKFSFELSFPLHFFFSLGLKVYFSCFVWWISYNMLFPHCFEFCVLWLKVT